MAEPTQQELQDAIEYRNKIFQRRKEVLESIPLIEDESERIRQELRAKALYGIYKDAAEEVKRLKLYFSDKKRVDLYKQHKSSNMDIAMMMGNVWADLSGVTWNQLSNYTWGREKIEDDSEKDPIADYIKSIIKQGITKCTDRQRFYMTQYYGVGKTLQEIGEENNVNKSTVQRCIVRGLKHISNYVTAKLLIQKCIDKNGYFDYMLFVNSCDILTDRQKEILYLILCTDSKQVRIAEFVDRNRAVINHTINRIVERLNGLAVEMNLNYSSIKIHKEDLRQINEKHLAEDLGLYPAFYYGICKRNKKINSEIPMLHYVIWREIVEKPSARNLEIAKYIGCSECLVDTVRKRYKGRKFPVVPIARYNRREPKRMRLPDNPYLILNKDFLIDSIDKETMDRIEKLKEGL